MSGVIPSPTDNRSAAQWPPQSPGQKPYPEMPVVPDGKPLLTSLGASGVAIFSGIITSEEYNPDFYWRDGIKIYEQMLRSDGQIRAMRMVVENPIKRAIWSIEPGSESPRDKEIASFVESCLFHDMCTVTSEGRRLHQSWAQILHHILMHLWYGFMTFEINWRVEDGWVKWARWEPLLPRTIWRWWVGQDTQLVGVQQWTFKDFNYAFVDIPVDKLLLFVHQQEGANFEGLSLLRTAYKHWWYKSNFEKIEAIGIERNAVVPPIITLPQNFTAADIAAAQTLGANMRASELGYATLPPGWLLDYPAHMQPFTAQVQPAIQYHDVMIARNVLAQFINLGSSETGAYALAEAQQEMFLQALEAVTDYICDTINNDAIQRLVDYNFDNVEVYPRLRASALANADITQVADAIGKLKARDANFLTPDPEMEDYLREQMHFPKAPRSVVQATNPTSDANADRPDNANASDHSDQQSAVQKTNPQNANTNQSQQSAATAGNNALAPAAPGDGGTLSEALGEDVRLLREAVASIAGLDAVERGMQFFNPNHLPAGPGGGEFAPGGGAGGGGGSAKASGGRGKGRAGAGAKAAKPAATKASGGRSGAGGSGAKAEKTPEEKLTRLRQREQSLQAEHDEIMRQIHEAPPHKVNGVLAHTDERRAALQQQLASVRTQIRNEETKSVGGKAKAEPKAAEEDIHARSARLQREQGLKAEVKPEVDHEGYARNLTPLPGTEGAFTREHAFDTVARSPLLMQTYGEHQLGAALTGYSHAYLKGEAQKLGVTPGHTRDVTLSRIVAHATEGRYSANFDKAESKAEDVKAEPKAGRTRAAKAEPKAETPASEGIHARSAQLQREQGLRAEVKPGGELKPVPGGAEAAQAYEAHLHSQGFDKAALYLTRTAENTEMQRLLYGEHQLGAALSGRSLEDLRERAASHGLSNSGTKAALVSRITAHATEGRYSADFGKAESKTESKAESKAGRTRAAKAEKPAEEGIHARSTQLQREQGLRAEAKPGASHPRPIKDFSQEADLQEAQAKFPSHFTDATTGAVGHLQLKTDRVDAPFMAHVYGEHQLGAVLQRQTTRNLQQEARALGIDHTGGKVALVSRITAHATQGRYSANFSKSGKASPAAAHAAKATKLKAAVDKAQAAYDAHMATAPKLSETSAHAREAARLLGEVERLTREYGASQ